LVSEEEFLVYADPATERHYAEADFRVTDGNGDGYITAEEYGASGHALELTEVP